MDKSSIRQNVNPSASASCQDLLSLLKFMKTMLADMAEDYGLTPIQLHALHAIKGDGGLGAKSCLESEIQVATTMGGLAQTLHCDASNVTGIVDRLTALALISRQEHPQDRRVKTLQLTVKGSRVIDSIQAELPAKLGCDRLNEVDRRALRAIVSTLQSG